MDRPNSISDDLETTCSSHKGRSFSYCRSCKSILCEECSSSHVDNKHEIKDARTIALKYKDRVIQYNDELSNQIKAGTLWLQKYQLETQSATEKVVVDLEAGLSAFMKLIRDEALARENGIHEEISGILKALEREALCSDYNQELEIIEKAITDKDQSQIFLLKKESIGEKYKVKKGQISGLLQNAMKTKEKLQGFIRDCKETLDIFHMWGNNSTARLMEVYERKISEIKECEDRLYEKTQQLYRQLEKNTQIVLENTILVSEKTDLKNSIKALKMHQDELTSRIEVLRDSCVEMERKTNILAHNVADKKSEIQNLESVIKSKQELLSNLSKQLITGPQKAAIESINYKEMQLLLQSNVIYIFDQKSCVLFIYHFDMKRPLMVKAAEYGIPSNHDSVQIRNDLYITGGFDTAQMQFSKSTLKVSFIDMENVKKEPKANMLLPKSQHKLVMLDARTIYSLGGKSKDKKFLSYCEKYNMEQDKWESAPSLNESKLNIAATAFNGTFIYAFGGFKGTYSNAIEFLNAAKPGEKWRTLKLASCGGWIGKDEAGCFQTSEKEILIFGGIDGSAGCTDDVFILNIEKRVVTKHSKKLCKKEWFTMRTPVRLANGTVCIAGYFANDIHIYKNENMTWTLLEEKDWKPTLQRIFHSIIPPHTSYAKGNSSDQYSSQQSMNSKFVIHFYQH
eukprot:TRINITY_DN530_c0_g3_i1.p2 TRINITY_DN530_c0_g3~~TRINITY_DN530_c0_g3_i1.p2  ORF type:complete len:682 (+),score=76.35 TRINITY_DN530_c0_g3_i1:3879-5924(+)